MTENPGKKMSISEAHRWDELILKCKGYEFTGCKTLFAIGEDE